MADHIVRVSYHEGDAYCQIEASGATKDDAQARLREKARLLAQRLQLWDLEPDTTPRFRMAEVRPDGVE